MMMEEGGMLGSNLQKIYHTKKLIRISLPQKPLTLLHKSVH